MFFYFDENDNKVQVPGFEQTIKPILMALKEKEGRATIMELNEAVTRIMNLPEDVLRITHKGSGKQSEMEYRIAWGRTYLKKYGLITNISRGIWGFTDKFDGNIDKIDVEEILRKVRSENDDSKSEKDALTAFESALAFENMVRALLQELTGENKKPVFSTSADLGYDLILPEGIEESHEETKCIIIYMSTSKKNSPGFYERAKKKIGNCVGDGKVLLITNAVVDEAVKNNFDKNIVIWDKEELLKRIEPEASYVQYLINPQQALIEDVVSQNSSDQQSGIEQDRYIKQIKAAFRNQDVVLFLGAGISIDGGVPLWGTLIKTLHVYMLERLTKDKALSFKQQEMIKELASDNEMESPLIQMRYIRAEFSDEEYYKLVHSALYNGDINLDTALLDAIARISTPQRGYSGIKSIITYNFDDLLERKLRQKDIQYNIISGQGDRQLVDKLNIYHVHGYLPSEFTDVPDEPNLIFSEEDYHRVYRDAYSWSNLTQLNALRENTGLFIGCSLTDPNLRRLLDVAARSGETPRHYAFLRRKRFGSKEKGQTVNKDMMGLYQKIDNNIKKAYYQKLGLNIIWIDNFDEIPVILDGFLR